MELNQPPPRGRILLPAFGALLLIAAAFTLALRALDDSTPRSSTGFSTATANLDSQDGGSGAPTTTSARGTTSGERAPETSSSAEPGRPSDADADADLPQAGHRSSSSASPSTQRSSIESASTLPTSSLRAAVLLEEDARLSDATSAYVALAADEDQSSAERALAAQAAARLAWDGDDISGTLSALSLAPIDPAAPEAHYLRGEALAASGQVDEAVAAYETYAEARPAMADEAALAAGNVLDAAGRAEDAAAAYQRAFDDASTPALAALAAIRAGNAWLDAEDPDAALAAYQRAEAAARASSEKAQALAGQVAAHLTAEDEPSAMALRQRLIAELPETAPARVALDRLRAAGEPIDPLAEGAVLSQHGELSAALALYEATLEDLGSPDPVPTETRPAAIVGATATATTTAGTLTRAPSASTTATPLATSMPAATTTPSSTATLAPLPDGAGDLTRLILELELELNRPAAALARAEAFLALPDGDDDPSAPEIAFIRTRALRALDRSDEEIEALAAFATTYPRDPLAYDALWRRALLIEQRDGEIAGGAAWAAAFTASPTADRAGDAGFRAGWLAYTAGRRTDAVARWQSVVDRSDDKRSQARAHYWLGRLAADKDEEESARSHWQMAQRRDPYGWYGLRAAQSLGVAIIAPEPLAEDDAPTVNPSSAIGVWLGRWAGGLPDAVSTAQPTVRAHPRLQRAAAYLALGRRRSAQRTLRGLPDDLTDDSATFAAFVLETSAMGLHDIALGNATSLLRVAPIETLPTAPRALWRLAYPDPWPEQSAAAASSADVPTALLLALIRQESRFEPGAISSAGARGLAQVMPGTGDGIASQLQEPNYQTDDLFRPSLSLRFGAYYIGQQLDRFDGRPGPALAAYNGGPRNAARWWPAALDDTDRLVETIDYRETRAYLRLVLVNYAIYEALLAAE